MTVLRATFGLSISDTVNSVVYAHNARGWSASSPIASGVTIATEPSQMASPTRGSSTTASQIEVTWTALTSPSNGDSTILTYNLQWDAGTNGGTWYHLVGYSPSSTGTSYTITSGITTGTSYLFRVRAKNIYGWGTYSDSASIKPSSVPG